MTWTAPPRLRNAAPPLRFWPKVDKHDSDCSCCNGCWWWRGARSRDGYGTFFDGTKTVKAHRWSWHHANAAIPEGIDICHHCDNPACVNPAHLFAGTTADNIIDCMRKGRMPQAKLTIPQVIEIRARWDATRFVCADVAKEFGVSGSTIERLVHRQSWAHVV